MQKILVVDNDPEVLGPVGIALEQAGYDVVKKCCGKEILTRFAIDTPDLFLIDVSLPETSGLALCRELRTNPNTKHAPIIFFADAESPYSVDEVLNSGGDDYIRKPFVFRVLLARIRAHLRRASHVIEESVIQLFPDAHRLQINDREIMLTRVEFELFAHLCRSSEMLHTANELLENVWHYPSGVGDSALVRNHIRNLRNKVEENPELPVIIQSRHGRGYMIKGQIQIVGAAPARQG